MDTSSSYLFPGLPLRFVAYSCLRKYLFYYKQHYPYAAIRLAFVKR